MKLQSQDGIKLKLSTDIYAKILHTNRKPFSRVYSHIMFVTDYYHLVRNNLFATKGIS